MSLGSCLGGRVKSVFGKEGAEDGIVTEDLLGKIRLIKWESGSESLVILGGEWWMTNSRKV